MNEMILTPRHLFLSAVSICRHLVLSLCSASLLVSSFSQAAWADTAIPYRVTIAGLEDPALLGDLRESSDSLSLQDRPPASLGLLRTRAERDSDRFIRLLHGHGHFGARVEVFLKDDVRPVELTFQIEPGAAYPVTSVVIRITGEKALQPHMVPSSEQIGLRPGKPFKASALKDAEKALVRGFEKQGFPFPRLEERKIMVDHRDRSVALEFFLDPGPQAIFGTVEIGGAESVDEIVIRRLIPWREMGPFSVEHLENLQLRLIRTGLFASVRVSKGPALDQDGRLPVDIAVTERKHRSVGAGISYKTDEGFGATALWEHRNLFSEGERLTFSGTASEFAASAESAFFEPFFLHQDQSLRLLLRVAEEQPDAYTSRNMSSSASVVRHLTEQLRIGGGLGYKASRVEQLGIRQSFSYLFLPLDLEWDRSDDLLDPAGGGRLGLNLVPFYDPSGNDPEFLKSRIRYRHYIKPLAASSLVLAAGLSVGSMAGAQRDEIPADERFYAGGGGSIRGYAYQSVGPFRQGEAVGGRSLLEMALEARVKVTERMGFVVFVDGGNAYEDRFPDLGEALQWGAGLGFRYFTPVGPLRLDLGFPLNRRPDVDDRFQVYISLGQAF